MTPDSFDRGRDGDRGSGNGNGWAGNTFDYVGDQVKIVSS